MIITHFNRSHRISMPFGIYAKTSFAAVRAIFLFGTVAFVVAGCSNSNNTSNNMEGVNSNETLLDSSPSPTVNAQEIEELLSNNGFMDTATEELYRCLLNQYMTEAGSKRWGDAVFEELGSSLILGWCNPLDNAYVRDNYCEHRLRKGAHSIVRWPGANNIILTGLKDYRLDPSPIHAAGVRLEQYPEQGEGDWAVNFDYTFKESIESTITTSGIFDLIFTSEVTSNNDNTVRLNLDLPLTVSAVLADDPTDIAYNSYSLEPIKLENELPADELIEKMLQSSDEFKSISLLRVKNLLAQSEEFIRDGKATMGLCGDAASGGCIRGIPLPENRQEEALAGVRTELNRRMELIETYATDIHRILAGKVDFSQCQ